jgi:Fe2+ transport system protein FeoA
MPVRDPREPASEAPTLADLRPGERARLIAVGGPADVQARLRDLGFREGEWVAMIKCAPLADPIEYSVQGAHIGLRREEASHIAVSAIEPVAADEAHATDAHGAGRRARHRFGWGRRVGSGRWRGGA